VIGWNGVLEDSEVFVFGGAIPAEQRRGLLGEDLLRGRSVHLRSELVSLSRSGLPSPVGAPRGEDHLGVAVEQVPGEVPPKPAAVQVRRDVADRVVAVLVAGLVGELGAPQPALIRPNTYPYSFKGARFRSRRPLS
jgi:hypothetical protein